MAIPCHPYSSAIKELYNISAFIVHAASLRQGSPHCGIFLAAASRRSLGRVSVPMWPFTLSGRLLIVALVVRYTPNQLMSRKLIPRRGRSHFHVIVQPLTSHPVLPCVSTGYPRPWGRSLTCYSPVRHSRMPEGILPSDLHA